MSLFIIILTASFIVSLVSFFGVALLILRSETIKRFSTFFVSFAAGTLLGVTFLDILPETAEMEINFIYVLYGIITFFILEKYFLWYHCHGAECVIHKQQSAPLILIGDALHNFIDGIIITLAFLVDINLGIVTTIAVILHEIPQEIGDFSILLYGGMTKARAFFFNFFVALTVVVSAILTYMLSSIFNFNGIIGILLAFVAGHFIYISTADLIPELHRETNFIKSFVQICLLLFGVFMIWMIGGILPH